MRTLVRLFKGLPAELREAREVAGQITVEVNWPVIFVLLALAALFLTGCASGYGPGDFARNTAGLVVSGLPRVEVPVLSGIGIVPSGQNIVLTNGTPFWCRWAAYSTHLGTTGPGDALAGSKYYEPLQAQIPVAVLCYRDPGFAQYVGAAGRVFAFYSGQPGGISWPLRAHELQMPEGAHSRVRLGINHPQPDTAQIVRRVEIPREPFNGTAALQIVNNTLFTMTQGVEGTSRAATDAGGLYYAAVREVLGSGRQVTGQLVFTDRGRLVGTYDFSFYVPSQGVVAYQLVISPWMIRR